MTPDDLVTTSEAAKIPGCSTTMVAPHVAAGLLSATDGRRQLSRADVEALALQIYHWRHHLYDVDPYWVTGERAAAILGVHISWLNRLVANDAVPFETHERGTRLYRREQLEVVAHARQARRPLHAGAQSSEVDATGAGPPSREPGRTRGHTFDALA